MIENSENIKKALDFIKSENYYKAIDILDVELEQNTGNINAFYFKGIAQTHLGRILKEKDFIESGIHYFKKAIALTELDPSKKFPDANAKMVWAEQELNKL